MSAESAILVRRIQEGDRGAEDELIERYRRGVRFVLSNSCRDSPTLDDLFQDTFRVALEKIRSGQVREPEKLAGFLCSIARNLAIEHYRKLRSRRTEEPSGDFPNGEPSALETLLRSEQAATAHRVLAELSSERDRQILFRFYIAEDGKETICRELALTSLHFNRVLFRARQRYRELYERLVGRKAR